MNFVSNVLGTGEDTEAIVSDRLCGAPSVHRHYFPDLHDKDCLFHITENMALKRNGKSPKSTRELFKRVACTVNDGPNQYDRLLQAFKEACTDEQWKYFSESILQGNSSPAKWASCNMVHEREGIYSNQLVEQYNSSNAGAGNIRDQTLIVGSVLALRKEHKSSLRHLKTYQNLKDNDEIFPTK